MYAFLCTKALLEFIKTERPHTNILSRAKPAERLAESLEVGANHTQLLSCQRSQGKRHLYVGTC